MSVSASWKKKDQDQHEIARCKGKFFKIDSMLDFLKDENRSESNELNIKN